jgi:hypothetical protein
MEFAMSWLASLFLAALSALMVVGLPRASRRSAHAPWWRGREMMASVVHFGLAITALVLAGLSVAPPWR